MSVKGRFVTMRGRTRESCEGGWGVFLLAFLSCPAGLERSKKSKGKGEISRGLWYVSLSLCNIWKSFMV